MMHMLGVIPIRFGGSHQCGTKIIDPIIADDIRCSQSSNDFMITLIRGLRSRRRPLQGLLPILLWAECTAAAMAGQSLRPTADASSSFERCQVIEDEKARLRCFEQGRSHGAPQEQSGAADTWRLVRTPNPAGGRDAVSIMQIADISGSDLEFAGLMLRCNDTSIDVLIVLVRPLAPHSHPTVEFKTGSKPVQFTANVLAPGALLLLPPEAAALAVGPWQGLPKLSITVEGEYGLISGVVSLTGLTNALQVLRANCQIP
jgi:hypothetical protein